MTGWAVGWTVEWMSQRMSGCMMDDWMGKIFLKRKMKKEGKMKFCFGNEKH